jgi:murein DD-endopeptidase MepM/ murein hydrolase activator NlpD
MVQFQWPVDKPQVNQIYACKNCIEGKDRYESGINIHTGVDVKPIGAGFADYTQLVKAAADGWVEKMVAWSNSHGLGNTIILRHANGKYTLYGHLDKIEQGLSLGQFVFQGSQLGIMGNSSSESARDSSFGTHVHFEIKDNPTLGNITDDGLYWGYTPGHPDLYGYHDPRNLVQNILVESTIPIAVRNPPPGDLNVRSGPGEIYIAPEGGLVKETGIINQIEKNQEFIAFKKAFVENIYWYYIALASTNPPLDGSPHPNNGPNGGWVSSSIVMTDSSATQIEVQTDSLRVRSGPGTSFSVVAKIYMQQRFVSSDTPIGGEGCNEFWYKIDLPVTAEVSQGWVCSEFIDVIAPGQ